MDAMRDTMEEVLAATTGMVGVGSPRASLEDNYG